MQCSVRVELLSLSHAAKKLIHLSARSAARILNNTPVSSGCTLEAVLI